MECANAALTIGGKIHHRHIARLAQALEDDHAAVDWTDQLNAEEFAELIRSTSAAKDRLYVCNSEQPWGVYEATAKLCQELGLIYTLEFEAGGEWHPGLVFRQPEMGTRKVKVAVYRDGKSTLEEQDVSQVREWPIAEIGRGPMLDAENIQRHLDAGTLADELAVMTAARKFPWPLEIVEDDRMAANRQTENGQ